MIFVHADVEEIKCPNRSGIFEIDDTHADINTQSTLASKMCSSYYHERNGKHGKRQVHNNIVSNTFNCRSLRMLGPAVFLAQA